MRPPLLPLVSSRSALAGAGRRLDRFGPEEADASLIGFVLVFLLLLLLLGGLGGGIVFPFWSYGYGYGHGGVGVVGVVLIVIVVRAPRGRL